MNRYPEYIEVKGIKYKIDTDFRTALECDSIARNGSIGEYEKMLAIIYKLLGEEALNDYENHEKLFNLCQKFLLCGENFDDAQNNEEEPSMDFEQDAGYIKASFMSDYQMDIDKLNIHWWAFMDLLRGLTENSVLNRVRYIREESLSDKKGKELDKWKNMKEKVALKRAKTKEEKEMDNLFESQMKGW